MKSILTETFSVIKVSLFWTLALPAAAIILSVVAGWQKFGLLISPGPIISTRSFGPQLRAAAR